MSSPEPSSSADTGRLAGHNLPRLCPLGSGALGTARDHYRLSELLPGRRVTPA